MKKLPLVVVTAAIGLVSAGSAQANCTNMSCVNRELNSLTKALKKANATIKADDKVLKTVVGCLGEVPLTQYGDPTNKFGYDYNSTAGGPITQRTAIDATTSGTTVDVWMLFDQCNTSKKPSSSASTGHVAQATRIPLAPIASEAPASVFAPQP